MNHWYLVGIYIYIFIFVVLSSQQVWSSLLIIHGNGFEWEKQTYCGSNSQKLVKMFTIQY